MNRLRQHREEYLTVRRALGYKLVGEAQLLAGFVAFAEEAGAAAVTTDLAVAWTRTTRSGSAVYLARRMRAVRSFARYLQSFDPATEIPSVDLFPSRKYRPTPYLYSDAEVAALMAAARELAQPLRAATFETLIGLLAATGLRISEAMRLDRNDLDIANGLLIVRDSKYGNYAEDAVMPMSALSAFLLLTLG